MAAPPQHAPSHSESELRRARGLLDRHAPAEALSIAAPLLEKLPENRDVLYIIAVSQRQLGQTQAALATLERLEALYPEFARLYQERGHCQRATGDPGAALSSYERAVALNSVLHASWRAIAELQRAAGRTAEASAAAGQLSLLARLPKPVLAASGLLAEGDLDAAERILRRFLAAHPQDIEAMRLLAQIGIRFDVLDDAEFLLESVLVLAPDYHIARYDYAQVLSKRHKHAAALEQVRGLLALDPNNRAFRTLYASVCVGLGQHEEALRTYRELAAQTPGEAELHLSMAHALKTMGHQAEAIEAYRQAVAARPSFGDAYWSLANLKTYRFTAGEIERMRAQQAGPQASTVDRYHLCFALGKALEDEGQFGESFRYYARGNALKRRESRYDPEVLERGLARQRVLCTGEFFAARSGYGCSSGDPIFIVGLPRSGSTLIEHILASHSQVEGTMELADIPRMVHQLQGREHSDLTPRYPAVLAELTAEQCRRLGEKYLADTRVYRGGRPFFIDKMPNNFRHLGLIHLILPNARIIDARREPMACCFSNFKQLFASGQEFTYSLADIARYYRAYLELMTHWNEVLPGKILRVQHEELVDDLEGGVRRLLDFLGLPFEARCLEYFRTERSVRTASSEQVRLPIFREGIDQWRNFEPWLGELKSALTR
ncbi:MAG TPA: sulfotransferase [Steroidobacteraceae bacterium]|nr:sulfotransferase [Steroidobacteraceae bacterium]